MGGRLNTLPLPRAIRQLTSRQFTVHTGNRPEPHRQAGVDFSFVFSLGLLLIFGLIMIYSATSAASGFSMLKKQILATVLGLGIFSALTFLDYRKYTSKKAILMILYGISAATMLFLLVKGNELDSHGAVRWINLGPVNFQPVELFKLTSIIITAVVIAKDHQSFEVKYRGSLFNYLLHSRSAQLIVMCGVIPALMSLFISNNMSSAIVLFLIPTLMTFMVNKNKKGYYILFAIIGIVVLIACIYGLTATPGGDFRSKRLCAWMRPEEFKETEAYQTIQSRYAIGSGGIFGKGLGKGLQKLGTNPKLPEAHNDMIFAVICEELGIFGAFITVGMFVLLLWRIRAIAKSSCDRLGMMLCMGVFFHVGIQTFVNIGVATGLIVNTGVSLPFISYGGSSVLFLLAEMGIVMSVARRRQVKRAVS